MSKTPTIQQLAPWLTVCSAQVVVLIASWAKSKPLRLYLSALLLSSSAGLAILAAAPRLYLDSYIAAGYIEVTSTVCLLACWIEELRKRARPSRAGYGHLAVLFAAAMLTMRFVFPANYLSSVNSIALLRTVGYTAYSYSLLVLILLPLYSWYTMALPGRRLLLQLFALTLVVASHATLLDSFMVFASSTPFAKRLHDFFYLVPLAIWLFAAVLPDPQNLRTQRRKD